MTKGAGSDAAGELTREQHVGELGRAVHEEAAVLTLLPVEVVDLYFARDREMLSDV